ncbi:methylenetetrahydrofolate reductase [Anopheles darlingi]|uniref:methylenetetrahydrofolate reductase n=1 Tax=Anopheles darlingi TaxID=43151 RepID=UPI00210031C2|nr:methylenetetrahydrofolate reductase [Anopheles darlingi]
MSIAEEPAAFSLREKLSHIFQPTSGEAASSSTRSVFYSIEIAAKDDFNIDQLRRLTPRPVFCSMPWISDENLRYEADFAQMPSLRLADQLRQEQFTVVNHLSCYNLTEAHVDKLLSSQPSIRNMFIVRGDTVNPDQRFLHSAQLVQHLRQYESSRSATAAKLTIGVGGYPGGHVESPSQEDELRHLADKVALGADFLLTQTLYDAASFFRYRDRCRAAGITIPIIPGIYLPHSYRQLQTMLNITRVAMSPTVRATFEEHRDDTPEAFEAFVVQYFVELVRELLQSNAIEPGSSDSVGLIHFFTFNKFNLLEKVISQLEFARQERVGS